VGVRRSHGLQLERGVRRHHHRAGSCSRRSRLPARSGYNHLNGGPLLDSLQCMGRLRVRHERLPKQGLRHHPVLLLRTGAWAAARLIDSAGAEVGGTA
jgi:hypothetical protein